HLSGGPHYQWWLTYPLALVRRSSGTQSRKQTFHSVFRRWHFRRAAAHPGAPSFRSEMDLVRWSDRVRHRVAKHYMAAAKSLAHVRAIEQHCSQRQKRRPEPGRIYLAADCFHESGNSSAVVRWVVLGVRFPRRSVLYGAWNHIPRHARRVHHFAWQKLLPRAR